MSKSSQRLSAILANRMKKTADGAVPTTIELGIVNSNLSITTDSLQAEIPKGDYMVNLALTGGLSITGGSHSGHSEGNGIHTHNLPTSFRGIQAGDRVLVAWCGNEPVVIAIVSTSTVLKFSDGSTSSGGDSSGSDSSNPSTPTQGGKDGFSPTVMVTQITGGNRITITDVNGPHTFDVMNGSAPVKGKDYFTSDEVDAIVQEAVKQAVASLEEKFYTKAQIDTMFTEKVITGEEIRSLITDVFGAK